MIKQVGQCTGGFVAWSFAEYAFHRWLGHELDTRFKAQHQEHHLHPNESMSIIWPALAIGALLAGPCELFWWGAVAGFFTTAWGHSQAHQEGTETPHMQHHRNPQKRFGVMTNKWDDIFRTS